MRSLSALALGSALLAFSAGAGDPGAAPRIVASEPVCVSGDRPGVPHVEPFLAAHPADPNLLFGAAVTLPDAGSGSGIEETPWQDSARSTVAMPGRGFPSRGAWSIPG